MTQSQQSASAAAQKAKGAMMGLQKCTCDGERLGYFDPGYSCCSGVAIGLGRSKKCKNTDCSHQPGALRAICEENRKKCMKPVITKVKIPDWLLLPKRSL